MQASTLSFRADNELAEQTRALANRAGLKSSEYIREAVREKNSQMLAQHCANISKKLSSDHLAFNESLEGSLKDGLN